MKSSLLRGIELPIPIGSGLQVGARPRPDQIGADLPFVVVPLFGVFHQGLMAGQFANPFQHHVQFGGAIVLAAFRGAAVRRRHPVHRANCPS